MKYSLKTCFGVICFIHIVSFLEAQPQNKLSISARADFYSIPINNSGTDIPFAKYTVKGDFGLNQAIYFDLNWWFSNSFGASFGFGMHNFNNSVDIIIPNSVPGFMPTVDDHRKWKVLGVSPTIGLLYRLNKFHVQFCVSNFEPISIKQSHFTQDYKIHNFNIETETWHSIEVAEVLTPSNSFYSYNLWQVYLHYQIANNFKVSLGFETTIGKSKASPYRIKIEEYSDLQTENKSVANDFAYTPYYRAVTFGMSYTLYLKKSKNGTDVTSNSSL